MSHSFPTQWKYISSRNNGYKQKGYIVQYLGQTHGGFHRTIGQAKQRLRLAMGLNPNKKLPLRKKVGAWKYKAKGLTTTVLLTRCRCLIKFAAQRLSQVPSAKGPQDLIDSVAHCTKSRHMYAAEGSMRFASLALKYGPCKDNLLQAWVENGKLTTHAQPLRARASHLQEVLKRSATITSQSPVASIWGETVNRFRQREMGPQIFWKRMRIIERARRGHGVSLVESQTLKGTTTSSKWEIGTVPIADRRKTCERFIKTCDAIVAAVGQAPRTCSEWASKMNNAQAAITEKALGFRPPMISGNYLTAWFIRSYMTDLMHESRVSCLKIDAEISVRAFVNMNPDQKSVLKRFQMKFWRSKAKKDVSNTRQFVASISRHAVRPELVSMMACFSCDKGFRVDDFKNFKVAEWLCKATELKSTSGLEPHYVHIAKALRKKD